MQSFSCRPCSLHVHVHPCSCIAPALSTCLLAWAWDDLPVTSPAGGWLQAAEHQQQWGLLGASGGGGAPLQAPSPPSRGDQVPSSALNPAAASCTRASGPGSQLCSQASRCGVRLSTPDYCCFCGLGPCPDCARDTLHVLGCLVQTGSLLEPARHRLGSCSCMQASSAHSAVQGPGVTDTCCSEPLADEACQPGQHPRQGKLSASCTLRQTSHGSSSISQHPQHQDVSHNATCWVKAGTWAGPIVGEGLPPCTQAVCVSHQRPALARQSQAGMLISAMPAVHGPCMKTCCNAGPCCDCHHGLHVNPFLPACCSVGAC